MKLLLFATSFLCNGIIASQDAHMNSFEKVQSIFDNRCVSCHSSQDAPGNLSLERGWSYRNLVNVPSSENATIRRIAPNDPENSYLYRKIFHDVNRLPFLEDPMPLGEEKLSSDDIRAIVEWINSFPQDAWGAAKNQEVALDADRVEAEPAFLATQLINLPTTRVLGVKTAEFRILHRFGLINGGGGNTYGSFFGLDDGANTSLNLSVAIREDLDFLVRRTGVNKDFEFAAKYVPFPHLPGRIWSLGLYASVDWISRDDVAAGNRFSPNIQILSSARLNPKLSFLIVPTLAFRTNHSDLIIRSGSVYKDTRYTMALGMGAQYEFRPNTAVTAEFIPRLDGYKGIANAVDERFNTWAVGLTYKIRLHVFQVLLTNTQFLQTTQYIAGSSAIRKNSLWDGGANVHFGFNIIRQFKW